MVKLGNKNSKDRRENFPILHELGASFIPSTCKSLLLFFVFFFFDLEVGKWGDIFKTSVSLYPLHKHPPRLVTPSTN